MRTRASVIQIVVCYFLVLVAMVVFLTSCISTSETSCYFSNCRETKNTMEDMVEWIEWDIQEGRIDSTLGSTYIYNISDHLVR